MRLLLVLALGLMLLCALSSCSAEEMGADMDAAAAAASSSRQWLQPVLLRHADSSDAREESLWDSVEPEYSDSSDDQEHTALLEETGTQHTPRIMRSSQFKDYMKSIVSNARPDHSLVETATEAHAQARLSRCKLVLNSWLHKCVF